MLFTLKVSNVIPYLTAMDSCATILCLLFLEIHLFILGLIFMVFKASLKRCLSGRAHREVKASPRLEIRHKVTMVVTKT
jgi:hypothetical protein